MFKFGNLGICQLTGEQITKLYFADCLLTLVEDQSPLKILNDDRSSQQMVSEATVSTTPNAISNILEIKSETIQVQFIGKYSLKRPISVVS